MKSAILSTVFCLMFAGVSLAEKPQLSRELNDELKKGLLAFQNEQFKLAAEYFSTVASEAPENPLGHVYLATVEYRFGKLESARERLRKAVELDMSVPQPWLTLGIICYELQALDEALAALTRAVFLDPKNPRARGYLGIVIGAKGWLHGAESELRKAIELDAEYANAHFNLALIYLQRTPPAKELARRHYQQALQLGAEPDALVEKQLQEQD